MEDSNSAVISGWQQGEQTSVECFRNNVSRTSLASLCRAYPLHGEQSLLGSVAEKAVFFCLSERSEGLWLSCVCWASSGAAEGMADTPGPQSL